MKLNELRDFPILHEDLNTIYNGLTLIGQGKALITMLNNYIIPSIALKRIAYLTIYDRELGRMANKYGVNVIP